MKAHGLATGQDHAAHGIGTAASALQQITQVQRAQLVLVRARDAVVAHRDQGDPIGCVREQGARGGAGGHQ